VVPGKRTRRALRRSVVVAVTLWILLLARMLKKRCCGPVVFQNARAGEGEAHHRKNCECGHDEPHRSWADRNTRRVHGLMHSNGHTTFLRGDQECLAFAVSRLCSTLPGARSRSAAARRPRWTEASRQLPLAKGRSRRTRARSSFLHRTAEATLGSRAPYWPTDPLHMSSQESCQANISSREEAVWA